MSDLARTPLHDWQVERGGRMVDFAGWSMPVQFTSIIEEHLATRSHAGLFDISHMGRIRFRGANAARFLDRFVTRRITDMEPGSVRYSLVTSEAGRILEDLLVYRLPDGKEYLLVVNARNLRTVLDFLVQGFGSLVQHEDPGDLSWADWTAATVMLALQGPQALSIAQTVIGDGPRLSDLRYYTCAETRFGGERVWISRTGYTGEDGVELIVPRASGLELAQAILAAGESRGLRLAGLGARDTLRLEAGMPLYGHELSELVDPYQAGLGFAVQLSGRTFAGRDALASLAKAPPSVRRVGLVLDGRRVPRGGHSVVVGEMQVGTVTSGTFSPTLQRPIAMAYILTPVLDAQLELAVEIRGTHEPATLVPLPFYRRREASDSS